MRGFPLLAVTAAIIALGAESPEPEIRKALDAQVEAWNRSDLKTFASYYSDDAIFVGKTPMRGRLHIFEMYQRAYDTPEKRGKLEFTGIETRMLGRDYASVVGHFRLSRTAAGGGDAAGIFSLLLARTAQGWKIILDHTS